MILKMDDKGFIYEGNSSNSDADGVGRYPHAVEAGSLQLEDLQKKEVSPAWQRAHASEVMSRINIDLARKREMDALKKAQKEANKFRSKVMAIEEAQYAFKQAKSNEKASRVMAGLNGGDFNQLEISGNGFTADGRNPRRDWATWDDAAPFNLPVSTMGAMGENWWENLVGQAKQQAGTELQKQVQDAGVKAGLLPAPKPVLPPMPIQAGGFGDWFRQNQQMIMIGAAGLAALFILPKLMKK